MNLFKQIMKKYWPVLVFLILIVGVFYKVFLYQIIPFPGDLLVSWFFPYKNGGWEGYSPWITHKEFIAADVVRELYPWRLLAMDLLHSGTAPLWNLYSYSGTPLLANFQTAAFYPINILFFAFSSLTAWNIYILVQPILAFICMYLFIKSLGLSKYASLFSAFCYGFIGYVLIWFELGVVGHTAAWLPLILFGIQKMIDTKRISWLVLASIGITVSILAGHAQTAAYVLIVSFAYFIIFSWGHYSINKYFYGILIMLLGVGVAAIQLLPSYELMQLSARDISSSSIVFHRMQLPFSHLVMLFAPDFFGNPATNNFWGKDYGEFMSYVGVVVVIFSVLGTVNFFTKSRVKFFIISIIVALLFALPTIFSNMLETLHVPVLGTGIPARSLFVVEFSLVALAAYGVEAFLKKGQKIFVPLISIVVVYIGLWGVTLAGNYLSIDPFNVHTAQRNLVLPTVTMGATIVAIFASRKLFKLRFIIFFLLLILASLEYQHFIYKYLPFAPAQYAYPPHDLVEYLQKNTYPNRVFGYDTARIETNLPVVWRILSPEGYDPLYIKRYGQLVYSAEKNEYTSSVPRSDALLASSMPFDDSYAKQVLMNLTGVKYVLDKDDSAPKNWEARPDRFSPNRFQLIWQYYKWKVYENTQALPRAAVFYNTRQASDETTLIRTLFDKDFPYKNTLLVEGTHKTLSASLSATPATITTYRADIVTLALHAKKAGVLFLSDAYYPGWRAFVDGTSVPILRSDFAFRGIEVPPGKHTVTFVYQPLSFLIGSILSGVSIVLLLISLALSLLYEKMGFKK